MQRLNKHTYSKITQTYIWKIKQAYICKDYTSIHMQRMQTHTCAKNANAYIWKDYTSMHMQR